MGYTIEPLCGCITQAAVALYTPTILKPFRNLAQTTTPDGGLLSLHEHDSEFYLKLNGRQLMSSSANLSELDLARIGCAGLLKSSAPRQDAHVLIGGLGFGFTLRGVLECLGESAWIDVAELLPEVVAWNREFLGALNGRLLEGNRVRVIVEDVLKVMRNAEVGTYDVILLDVDNGPVAMVQGGNANLYKRQGFEAITRALKPGGQVAFWSASQDLPFLQRLSAAGFKVQTHESKAHERSKRAGHYIYVAQIPGCS